MVSVALYLRVLAVYLLGTFHNTSATAERGVVTVLVTAIALVGMTRGFHGLERLEQLALGAALVLVLVLVVGMGRYDLEHFDSVRHTALELPSMPSVGTLAVLGGVLITVQGFETVRFLGDYYDPRLRISASRWAQAIAAIVYVALAVVVAPLLVTRGVALTSDALLVLTRRVLPFLAIPLVVIAVGSQLSAAIADSASADEGSQSLSWLPLSRRVLYAVLAAIVVALVWVTSTYQLVALASRAFAVYYALTSIAAAATAPTAARRGFHAALAVLLVGIVVFARPAS